MNWYRSSPQGKSLKQQIQELNDILCKFEIDARFEDQAYKFNNETTVTLEIKPRAITDNSKIILTNMRAVAHGRLMEF